jgi:hypothetical protein
VGFREHSRARAIRGRRGCSLATRRGRASP